MMRTPSLALLAAAAGAALWAVPFLWMLLAAFRPGVAGADDIASLLPAGPFGLANFREAWSDGHFPLWYANTLALCAGILAVQCVTVSLAGYAFARLRFPGRDTVFTLFLLQILLPPVVLVVPNLDMIESLGLFDTLAGIAAPYCASAFGVFLMRQTFRAIPRDFEDAAMTDGA
ncbi:MAG: carbohydrate ABC transporter permease, partial [Acidisphaera sp.]|nr:carbohydrate ABC transporter permease [Acidisphaera sp.]